MEKKDDCEGQHYPRHYVHPLRDLIYHPNCGSAPYLGVGEEKKNEISGNHSEKIKPRRSEICFREEMLMHPDQVQPHGLSQPYLLQRLIIRFR